jgi:hypothetical protein
MTTKRKAGAKSASRRRPRPRTTQAAAREELREPLQVLFKQAVRTATLVRVIAGAKADTDLDPDGAVEHVAPAAVASVEEMFAALDRVIGAARLSPLFVGPERVQAAKATA